MRKTIRKIFIQHWDALLASIVVCIVIHFLTRFAGIGISPDSVGYSVAALNFREQGIFKDLNGFPLVDFPLGYPMILSFVYFITGIKPVLFAPYLNMLFYAGILISCSALMHKMKIISRWYRICILLLLATSPCLWEVYGMLWSETLFLFLICLSMLAWSYYTEQYSLRSLFLFSIIVGYAFFTRFAGISLFITGFGLILMDGAIPLLKKIFQLLIFTVIGLSFVLINFIRNHLVSGTLSGVREKAIRTVADNLLDIGAVLGSWFPFIGEQTKIGAAIFLILLIFASIQIIFRLIQQQFYTKIETFVYSFFVAYSIFIVSIASISRFEQLSSRLLAPIFIPILFVGTSRIPPFTKQFNKKIRLTIISITVLFFLSIFKFQYFQNALNWEGIADAGIPGYSEKQWMESPTILYIQSNKDSITGAVYSDAYDGLYYLTGVKSLPLPHKEIESEQVKFYKNKELTVVWFNDGVNNDLIDISTIGKHKKLKHKKSFEDGTIYYYEDSVNVNNNNRN